MAFPKKLPWSYLYGVDVREQPTGQGKAEVAEASAAPVGKDTWLMSEEEIEAALSSAEKGAVPSAGKAQGMPNFGPMIEALLEVEPELSKHIVQGWHAGSRDVTTAPVGGICPANVNTNTFDILAQVVCTFSKLPTSLSPPRRNMWGLFRV